MSLDERSPEDFLVTTISDSFRGTNDSATLLDLYDDDIIELYELGQAVSLTVWEGTRPTVRDSIYFEEFLDVKDKYSYLLGPLKTVISIETQSDSGRKLLVFKDSYAHCMMPMLLDDYSEIMLVDLRYYVAEPTYMEELHVSDYDQVLFMYSCDVFAHNYTSAKL